MSENPMLYAGVGEPITGNKKKLCPGNVKKSAQKFGHSRTYLDIAGQRLFSADYQSNYMLNHLENYLYLYIEVE